MKKTALFLILILVASCQHPVTDSDDFKYPMAVGNSWYYVHTFNATNISGDTAAVNALFDIDPSNVHVSVTGKYVVHDTIPTYIVKIKNDGTSGFSEDYYRHTADALYMIAYRNAGAAPVAFPKADSEIQIAFNEKIYHSLAQIHNEYVPESVSLAKVSDDSLVFEEYDVISLKYPLQVGSFWYFREYYPWTMGKTIEKRTSVTTPAGTFDCFQLKMLYDIDQDKAWDDNIYIIDQLAAEGLIKREIHLLGTLLMDTEINEIAAFDLVEEITLFQYTL